MVCCPQQATIPVLLPIPNGSQIAIFLMNIDEAGPLWAISEKKSQFETRKMKCSYIWPYTFCGIAFLNKCTNYWDEGFNFCRDYIYCFHTHKKSQGNFI